MPAISHSDRKVVSIWSWKSSPSTTIGMLPMMISQPIFASGSLRGMRPASAWNHRLMMRTMSRQKNSTTAASVPICVIAVKAAPGSCAPGRNSPRMRRCALDDTGRNSVSP